MLMQGNSKIYILNILTFIQFHAFSYEYVNALVTLGNMKCICISYVNNGMCIIMFIIVHVI